MLMILVTMGSPVVPSTSCPVDVVTTLAGVPIGMPLVASKNWVVVVAAMPEFVCMPLLVIDVIPGWKLKDVLLVPV